MSSNLITQPYGIILNPTGGGGSAKPVANGRYHVGIIDLDPVANPRTDLAYKDESGTERPLTSPLFLNNSGAFVVSDYDGTLIQPYMKQGVGHSVLITDKRGSTVYSDNHAGDPGNIDEVLQDKLPEYTDLVFDSVTDMVASDAPLDAVVQTKRYNVDVISIWSVSDSIPATHTEGINALQLGNGNYALLISDDGDVRHYGAGLVTVADEGPLWNAAIKHVNKAYLTNHVTSYAREIELIDKTYIRVEGSLRHTPNSPSWSRVLTNKDRVNGNKDFTVDFTGGEAHGNQANQPEVNQHYFLFINCQNCLWLGGTLKENRALNDDVTEIPLTPHPDGPFNQGVKRGEPSYNEIESGFGYWIGGKNNHAIGGIKLLNWQKEGFSMRWVDSSSIREIDGVGGPEVEYSEYAPVDWTTRAGTKTISVGDHVLVLDGHEYNGLEQQPHLIYKALVSGSIDLGAEDYTNKSRWDIVERDISKDYGYTVARITGGLVGQNSITNAKGSFCRASTFSNDSELAGMDDLTSYHNSYNVGINFGHSYSPTNGSRANNLIAINPGWAGGTGGNSYGINVGGNSKDVSLDGLYVCGAGRNALNVSDGSDRIKASNGTLKFSGDSGALASSAKLELNNITSKSNAGSDFRPVGDSVISLNNCTDSLGNTVNNDRLIETSRPNVILKRISDFHTIASAGSFSLPSSKPLLTIKGNQVIGDAMSLFVTYIERNSGSGSGANQRAVSVEFGIFGSGASRTVQTLDTRYELNRKLQCSWDSASNSTKVYLRDASSNSVDAANTNNSVVVEVKNSIDYEYTIVVG